MIDKHAMVMLVKGAATIRVAPEDVDLLLRRGWRRVVYAAPN